MNNPVTISSTQTSVTGNSQPVDIRTPYLGVNFVIALEGIYPTQQ